MVKSRIDIDVISRLQTGSWSRFVDIKVVLTLARLVACNFKVFILSPIRARTWVDTGETVWYSGLSFRASPPMCRLQMLPLHDKTSATFKFSPHDDKVDHNARLLLRKVSPRLALID